MNVTCFSHDNRCGTFGISKQHRAWLAWLYCSTDVAAGWCREICSMKFISLVHSLRLAVRLPRRPQTVYQKENLHLDHVITYRRPVCKLVWRLLLRASCMVARRGTGTLWCVKGHKHYARKIGNFGQVFAFFVETMYLFALEFGYEDEEEESYYMCEFHYMRLFFK